jgi:hypothetical protein
MDSSKHLFAACACAVTLILTGCASAPGTTVALMPLQDLDDFKTDCTNKDQQIEFLQRQIPDRAWRNTNQQIVNSTGGALFSLADGTYAERMNHARGYNQAVARRKIYYLQTWCPKNK